MTVLKKLIKFQHDRKLDEMPYNAINEATNIIEELLEAMGGNIPKVKRQELFDLTEQFLTGILDSSISERMKLETNEQRMHERIDAFGDIIVFSIGAIEKLGYDAEIVLEEVSKEINSRVGKIVDGKFQKSTMGSDVANWYKANFTGAKRVITTFDQRDAFFKVEGYLGSDEEVLTWVKSLQIQ